MRLLTDHIVEGDSANHQVKISVVDEPGSGGASHRYSLDWYNGLKRDKDNPPQSRAECFIRFQDGPIKEVGVNGLTGEALTAIQIDRMRSFQAGPFACTDNAEALAHYEAAQECLQRRTKARIARGVEGTHQV